ncbi:MAG: glycosyltransferase family 39 protein, partial [Alphaproteobacteria bacterium]|nr:glycosyltransferase family 39 protein [Alphaproteobacteria bacterium]
MRKTDTLILFAIAALALVRLVAIAITPLGLDVEEAQYWLWSTTPDAGYFTKPPMIAWVIGAGTAIFGDSSFGVRALAPIIQAISTLLIWRLTRDAFTPQAGRWAAVIWMTLPAGALGGFIISTDSPMILFMLSALVVLAPLARQQRLSPMACL